MYRPNYLKLINRATSYYAKALRFSRPASTSATPATDPALWGFVNSNQDINDPFVTLNDLAPAAPNPAKDAAVPIPSVVPQPETSVAAVVIRPGGTFTKPPIRTYSRKRKSQPVPESNAEVSKPLTPKAPRPRVAPKVPDLPLLPPSFESLIGFRGELTNAFSSSANLRP